MNRYLREFGEITELVRASLLRTTNDSLYDKGIEFGDFINQIYELFEATDLDDSDLLDLVANTIDGLTVPIGAVTLWPVNEASGVPDGRLVADGSEISRSTYADLFAVIGTYYGAGDGSTTFDLPNLVDTFVRFTDTSGEVDPDYTARTAASGGSANTVGSTQSEATGPPNSLTTTADGEHNHSQDVDPNPGVTAGQDIVSSNDYSSHKVYTNNYTHDHNIGGGDALTEPKKIKLLPLIRY